MARKFLYMGKEAEELKSLSIGEFSNLLPSRERRKIKRGFTDNEKKLLRDIDASPEKKCRTHARDMVIIPKMVGRNIAVYTGKEFKEINILPEMLGHRLGEYALSRGVVQHSAPGVGATRSSKFVPLK